LRKENFKWPAYLESRNRKSNVAGPGRNRVKEHAELSGAPPSKRRGRRLQDSKTKVGWAFKVGGDKRGGKRARATIWQKGVFAGRRGFE